MFSSHPPMTHATTAWLLYAVTPALTVAALLVVATLLRPGLTKLVVMAHNRHGRRTLAAMPEHARPDVTLLWAPEALSATQVVSIGLAIAITLGVGLALVAPLSMALLLGLPLAAVALWVITASAERRYVTRLEQELTAAVGRLGAMLKAGTGLRPALERVTSDMAHGPLRDEWIYLVSRQGMPLDGGGIATAQQVVTALADQTPSRRHSNLLNHLGASVGQPQEVLARRCEAAYAALQASDRRRDDALTELAQMRYSGIAVGLAGVTMAAYLAWTQWERMILAYNTPLGFLVAPVVLTALVLPIIGGVLLAQVEDADY